MIINAPSFNNINTSNGEHYFIIKAVKIADRLTTAIIHQGAWKHVLEYTSNSNEIGSWKYEKIGYILHKVFLTRLLDVLLNYWIIKAVNELIHNFK